jgi:hypothetical protein
MFCSLSFSNGIQWVTIAPIAQSFKINYKVNSFEADLISLLYMMVYPFVTPISSFIVDNYSMRLGVNII